MKKIELSKSKIKEMVGCELMLFNSLNNPKEKVWDKQTLAVFEQGRRVEQIARDMFPKGVLQDKRDNYEKVLLTKELLKKDLPIFEAAFATRNTIVQFDILSKHDDFSYNAVEIKSSSKFKPDYETDVLIQYWIATLSGISINRFELWFVNKNYVKSSSYENYFTKHDVTEFVKSNERKFWELLTRAEKILNLRQPPQVLRSAHCDKLECPYRNSGNCALNKTTDSVFSIPRFPNSYDAYHKGIVSIQDPRFDESFKYSDLNPLIVKSIRENKLVIDKLGLNVEFSKWKFPLNFFDFETLMSAIPILEHQKPFEQVAFQFSNHVYDGLSDKLSHSMFLHDSLNNPNVPMIDAILSTLEKNDGSIVAYNKSFEQTRIKELAIKFPNYSSRLLKISERFVDLMDLVKDFVYHPSFMGSYSLKVVSPTLLGEFGSYSDSLIKSGSEIASVYSEMLSLPSFSKKKKEIKDSLEKYCFYDTLNLFLLLKFLLNQNSDLKELVRLNSFKKEVNKKSFFSIILKKIFNYNY